MMIYLFPAPAQRCAPLLISLLLALLPALSQAESYREKTQSVFFPPAVTQILRSNLAQNPAAQAQAQACLTAAQAWLKQSDVELWSAMFGATIQRSWHVWSNGFCPQCRQSTPMNTWKIDALNRPWKVACPHCQETFPKNDFAAFYKSGIDAHGIFDSARADRSLLVNADHPAATDPLHRFGVDDGTGYSDGSNRWHFIGAYLIYGQWKQVMLTGIRTLAMAYVITGDPAYAHKAAIMLDRVADLYPTFDFLKQGLSYERVDPVVGAGMVTVWHDACRESMELALAYDMIFPALDHDPTLVSFLSGQARQYQLPSAKDSIAAIKNNIETGILREVSRQPQKIISNFPNTDITLIISQAVLAWPENRDQIIGSLQSMLTQATAVDGLSGEKGLAAYSTFVPRTLANVLALFDRLSPDLLPTLVKAVPNLQFTHRFHVDTWLGEKYYPKIGDAGAFGAQDLNYAGAAFSKNFIEPALGGIPLVSDYTIFWRLYEITHDPLYVQLLYRANGNTITNLPYDLAHAQPAQFQQNVAAAIRTHGTAIKTASVNKSQWGLGILRSGTGDHQRAVWLDYDIAGNHGRGDALNIGLFAHGLEILSGFGYPPVQFGGWYSPRANWYKMTAAHNTVVVDAKNQLTRLGIPETEPLQVQLNPRKGSVLGTTTAWVAGEVVKLIRAEGPALVQTTVLQKFERSLLLIDISLEDSYLLDIFRVTGGHDHAKFMHGYFGTVSATGIPLNPLVDFGPETQMRNFRGGTPTLGWQVDWKIEDRYRYLPPGAEVHLRYTDLTSGTQAALAESWLIERGHETWVPSLLVRRQGDPTRKLASTFAAILEPYTDRTKIKTISRISLLTETGQTADESNVGVMIQQANGRSDLLIAAATGLPSSAQRRLIQPAWAVSTDADFCLIRRDANNEIEYLFLSGGRNLQVGDLQLTLTPGTSLFEARIEAGKLVMLRGTPSDVLSFRLHPNQ